MRQMRQYGPRQRRSFLRAADAVSAVEFALLAPLLLALLVGIVDVGRYAYQRADMFGAVRAGAQYFMAGGGMPAVARGIINDSWSQRPPDGEVRVDRFCQCAEVPMTCSAPCPDGEAPAAFSRIVVRGTYRGILMSLSGEATEIIRVR